MNETLKTRRAYLVEPYRRNFTAQVRQVVDVRGQPAAVLSETWFYPEGGGQPADRGTLGPAQVLDVQEMRGVDVENQSGETGESGLILHLLDRPVAIGEMAATIDWDRRFDHMQQHTGQHLLSRCFEEVAAAATVSFHLGVEEVTIDLDRADLAAEHIADAENLANRTVISNLPVSAVEVEPIQAAELGVAKITGAPAGGLVRVVMIGGFDRTACGGTHVAASGEIGPIKVRRYERKRGHARIVFHCGNRSLADYAWRHEALRNLGLEFTTSEREIPGLVARMAAERRDLERRLHELEAEVARQKVTSLLAEAERVGTARIVRAEVDDMDAARALATLLVATTGVVSLIGVRGGDRPRLLLAASPDVAVDLAAVMREVAPMIGGRGGGRARWAEAGGEDPARLVEALGAAAARVRAQLSPTPD